MKHRYIYISGPYSKGDVALNVRRAIEAADMVMSRGDYPYVPHLSHFWHMQAPHDYEDWMTLDLAWVDRCDALIRLPGESPGADREVAAAQEFRKPIYYGSVNYLIGKEGLR